MADVQVSYYDLTRLNNAVAATLGAVNSLQSQTNHLQSQVNTVDRKIERVDQELLVLWNDFRNFVKIQENRHNVDVALAKITHVRQELEQKFGKHRDARVRLRGILDAADTDLLREHTIELCSEQIMLDTPKYWLSPCLVTLAAWISNNKDLAYKAIKVALKRDVEKTSLLFALICRKTVPAANDSISPEDRKVADERQKACFAWLTTYFELQDPMKMKSSVIVLVDSWANDIFGRDTEEICKNTFEGWMEQIKAVFPQFEQEQLSHWKDFYVNKCVSTADTYKVLSRICPEFSYADAYLARTRTADAIQAEFDAILRAQVDKEDLINRLDEQLEALISDFDPEEEGLRREEERYVLIDQFEGDMELVQKEEARRARTRMDKEVSFAQRLEEAVRSGDPKYNAARQTAIKEEFLGRYINNAYTDYITEKKADFPEEITMTFNNWKGWRGRTKDAKNGEALKASYTHHMNGHRDQELAAVKSSKLWIGIIVLAIIGIVGFIAAPVLGVLGIVAAGVCAFMFYGAYNKTKLAKATINEQYDKLINDGCVIIDGALYEWTRMLAEKEEFERTHGTVLKLG